MRLTNEVLVRFKRRRWVSQKVHKSSYLHLADKNLMALVADSDTGAFATLYDRHSRAAYSLARKLTNERQTAEDLAQDAFLKVWRSAGSYRAERGSVRGWIFSVVRNQSVDLLRSQATRRRTQEKVEAWADLSQPSEGFAQAWRNSRRNLLWAKPSRPSRASSTRFSRSPTSSVSPTRR
jgi:RNA polymerase sigma factor (sigma-70 family)